MKMLQWGHAQEETAVRAESRAHSAALTTVLGVAVATVLAVALFAALSVSAKAEEYTPHLRHVAVRRVEHRRGHHAVTRTRTSANHTRRVASYRTVSARRSVVRERRAVARRTARPAPTLRRVSSRRRRELRRRNEPEVVASAKREDVRPETSGAAKDAPHTDAAADASALTVDDFMRAAESAKQGGVYASGVSRPDENVGEVTASVDAAPANGSAKSQSAPSDLVGAPLVADSRTTRGDARPAANREERMAAAEVAPPTHMEMAEAVEQPVVLPGLYRNGRLVVLPPMRGTREILVHQNLMADEEGLTRVQDDDDLRRMRAEKMLVDFPESAALHVNPEMGSDRRCARPWTVRFATNIARAYYARFHEPLQLNSAVRTVAYQVRLRRVNGNAAGIEGDVASPHLTGEAIDFGKHGMSRAEIAWMRLYLRPLMQEGKLDVEEEFQQACFHISVYRSYAPDLPVRRRVRSEFAQVQTPRVDEDQ